MSRKLDMMKELLARRNIRAGVTGLLEFTKHTKPDYQIAPFHSMLCAALDRVVAGKVRKLMVFAAPRMGKSELISRRLPAYMMGRYPGCNIMSASFGADLSADMAADVRRVIASDAYQVLYEGVTFGDPNQTTNFRLNNGSTYKAAGVGGPLTGRGFGRTGMGSEGGIGIIDDPIRSREDADSATMREKIHKWYISDFLSRREGIDAPIILMHQRWHEDDLAGRLLRDEGRAEDGGEWEVLSLPIIDENGISQWPAKFSQEFIEQTRRSSGSREWASKYMQTPTPDGGGIFKRQTFQYFTQNGSTYTELSNGREHNAHSWRRFATMDIAVTEKASSDWTVLGIWVQSPDKRIWLIDLVRDRMETPDLLNLISSVRHRYGVPVVHIETNGVGLPVFQSAQAQKLPVMPVDQHKDKVARAQACTPWFERGDVMLPRDAHWLATFESELLTFPHGTHDDQVDCLSTAIALADGMAFGYAIPTHASGALAYKGAAADFMGHNDGGRGRKKPVLHRQTSW